MSDLNNYQSGGRGYIGPNQAIEQATYREFMNQSGGKEGIASMDQAQIANILQGMLERIANETKMANEELSQMVSAIRDSVMNASNSQQGAKDGMNLINKIISSNTNLMQGLQNQKTTSSSEKGILGAINNNPIKQMVHLNQGILNTIRQIDSRLEKAGLLMGKIQSDMIDISIDNNADNDRNHAEQMEEFDGLRQTIAHGLMNSPLATKLGQLGTSLMNLGLMKVMGNENAPDWLRKGAATAIYLEIPQTLMMILGTVIGQKFSNWLSGSVSKHLGGSISNVLNWVKANPMLLMKAGGYALIAAGAVTAITGAIKHHKEMKANDEAIENSNMSRAQKDMAKIGAHTKSGAKVGGLSGFLAGAGAGALYGATAGSVLPGAGTIGGMVIGGVVGGIGGLLGGGALGGLIGSIKPLLQGIWHFVQFISNGVMASAKWAIENREKILKFIQPIGQALLTLLSITSPFFLAFRPVFEWVKKKLGGGDEPYKNTVFNPGSSNAVGNFITRLDSGSTKYTKDKAGNAYLGGHLITSDYGWRIHPTGTGNKMDGQKHFHKGIDIAYNAGDNIGAYVGGTIESIQTGHNGGYGNTVVVRDKNGVLHKYHHGQSIQPGLKVGDTVKQGQTIMQAGMSGNATGVHLDYEVWEGGKTSHPLEYLARYTEQEKAEKKKAEEEKKKAEEEKFIKEHPYQAQAKNLVKNSLDYVKDLTGMKDYTNKTNTIVNVGAN